MPYSHTYAYAVQYTIFGYGGICYGVAIAARLRKLLEVERSTVFRFLGSSGKWLFYRREVAFYVAF